MIKILQIILRSIFKARARFLVLITGLVAGLCGFFFLMLIVSKERSYDKFHSNYENIYRLITVLKEDQVEIPHSQGSSKGFLSDNLPSLQSVTHFIPVYYGLKVKSTNDFFIENSGLYVDESFNRVFDFHIVEGDPGTMFSQLNSIVITTNFARKYFGRIDVVGQTLTVDDGWGLKPVNVAGVLEPVPGNSSLKFDFLMTGESYGNWSRLLKSKSFSFFTFAKFKEPLNDSDKKFIQSIIRKQFHEQGAKASDQYLQPIQDVHLSTNIRNDLPGKVLPNQLYILWFTAISILLLTAINFINTNSVQASSKIKFLGVLKILGHKNPAFSILITDGVIKSVIALMFVLGFVVLAGPSIFSRFFDYELIISMEDVIRLIAIGLGVGIIAGTVPATLLRRSAPVDMVKGNSLTALGKYSAMKLASLTLQFFLVTVLMVVSYVVLEQIDYTDSLDMGYQKDDRILIPAPHGVGGSYAGFIDAARNLPDVTWVGSSMFSFFSNYREGTTKIGRDDYSFKYNLIDKDYLTSMGIEIKEGKGFKGLNSDTLGLILNETAAVQLGVATNRSILGSFVTVSMPWYTNTEFRVIGIMKDFHFKSLQSKIEPLGFFYLPTDADGATIVEFKTSNLAKLESDLYGLWRKNGFETPFEFELLTDAFNEVYKEQSLIGKISKVFAVLAFFIALFGLVAYLKHNLEFRKREFAIRRILGASPYEIYNSLNRQMLIFFVISSIMGAPIAYYVADRWLSQFSYHTDIDWLTFIIPTGLIFLVVILLGVYFQRDVYSKGAGEILKTE